MNKRTSTPDRTDLILAKIKRTEQQAAKTKASIRADFAVLGFCLKQMIQADINKKVAAAAKKPAAKKPSSQRRYSGSHGYLRGCDVV